MGMGEREVKSHHDEFLLIPLFLSIFFFLGLLSTPFIHLPLGIPLSGYDPGLCMNWVEGRGLKEGQGWIGGEWLKLV